MRRSFALALLAVLASSALAGCLADRQRADLAVEWQADARLWEVPVEIVDGWPAQLVLEATVSLKGADAVELTGLGATVTTGETERALQPMRLVLDDGAGLDPLDLGDETLLLEDGTLVQLTFVPSTPGSARLATNASTPVRVELRWRFAEGDLFDAGRLVLEENRTAAPAPTLGTGAPEVTEGRLERVVFRALEGAAFLGETEAAVYRISAAERSAMSPIRWNVTHEEGISFAAPTPELRLPDGSGYLLLIANEPAGGAVIVPLEPEVVRTPAPGLLLVLGVLAVVAGARIKRVGGKA